MRNVTEGDLLQEDLNGDSADTPRLRTLAGGKSNM